MLSLEQQEFVKYGLPPGCTSPYSDEGKRLIKEGYPKGTTCITCPFRGELLSADSLEDVSNDFSEASYYCHILEVSVWAENLECRGSWNI